MIRNDKLAKRIYTRAAIEAWFRFVTRPWESFFNKNDLEQGRDYYKSGIIQELELSEQAATVHIRFTRKESAYAVIEFEKGRPVCRGSTTNHILTRATAVAGLYEIEELVSEALAPTDETGSATASSTEETDEVEEEVPDAAPAPPRPLRLRIGVEGRVLTLQGFWQETEAPTREARVFSNKAELANPAERELIVRLTAQAGTVGFRFQKQKGRFVLTDSNRFAAFLKDTLPVWRKRFGEVTLEPEVAPLARPPQAIRLVGRAKPGKPGRMQIGWSLKLGERVISGSEASRILRKGKGTHVVSGLGLGTFDESLPERLQEWKIGRNLENLSESDWPRYMLFSLFARPGVEIELRRELARWKETIEKRQQATAPFPGLDRLRDYQKNGVAWLRQIRDLDCHALLADDMGLGKTLQVLAFLASDEARNLPALIVCPSSVVPVWESEVLKWYPHLPVGVLKSGFHFGEDSRKNIRLWIASYTQLRRHKHLLDAATFRCSVLDEAQQIRNPDAKISQTCCAIRADTRIALSGTPLENRPLDIWTLFRFLMPGLLGSRTAFEALFEKEPGTRTPGDSLTLRQQIEPFVLRRTKEAVVPELPAKAEFDLHCPLTDRQRQLYRKILAEGRCAFGDDPASAAGNDRMSFFAMLTRLRQVCCDPGLLPGQSKTDLLQSGKIQSLLLRIEEALKGTNSRKIVIFTQFVTLLKRLKPVLREQFPETPVYTLTGATRDRGSPVREFQEQEGSALFLISLKAGGTGITLHAADYVFLLDPWWNPAVEQQAIDRIHRIGQTRKVFVYRLLTRGTIEEKVRALQAVKDEQFRSTFGPLEKNLDWLADFQSLEALAGLVERE